MRRTSGLRSHLRTVAIISAATNREPLMTRRFSGALAGIVLTALLSTTALAEVVYNRGNDSDPETLDQHKTSTVSEAHILRDLYEGLVVFGPEAEVLPGVAESWTVSDDNLVYTFKLRQDAK